MFTQLVDEESRSRQLRVLAGRGVPHELEVRVAVGDVPDDVRRKQDQGDRGRQIRTAGLEVTSEAGQEKAGADARTEPEHARLVQQPEPQDQAEKDPSSRGGALREEDEDVRRQEPEEDVEAVHRVVGVEAQNLARADEGERRDDHGRAAAAQPAGRGGTRRLRTAPRRWRGSGGSRRRNRPGEVRASARRKMEKGGWSTYPAARCRLHAR